MSDDDDWNRDFDPRSDARERALNVLFEADVRGDDVAAVVARIKVPFDDLRRGSSTAWRHIVRASTS